MDFTTIHPASAHQAHLVDLHMWRGAPQNQDPDHPVQILVNHGYVVGFCPSRFQPAWSAYRVAHGTVGSDFERPLHYYDDMRLEEALRVGRGTFGKLGDVSLNVGHMTPNEVINRQFGRLAQMETFLMSNMSPQYAALNQGVWLKLENAIRAIEDEQGKDHVWAIVGPIYGSAPRLVSRGHGKHVPVPDFYFCIIVDPFRYPYDTPSRVRIDCFKIPQSAPRDSTPDDYPATLEEIEALTKLKFFDGWGRTLPVGQMMQAEDQPPSRIMKAIAEQKPLWQAQFSAVEAATPDATTIDGLIAALKQEAAAIHEQAMNDQREPTPEEQARLVTLQHTLSWLIRAREIAAPATEPAPTQTPERAPTLITYKVVADMDDKLKRAARTACNFWNRFVRPKESIVVRLGTFTENSGTIACAWVPEIKDGVLYGRVEFNTRFLMQYPDIEIAGTIVHEIGHTLGFGWETWLGCFDHETGRFNTDSVGKLADLDWMEVELKGGPGTALSHWSEGKFDKELMTGFKDVGGEVVMPVTIGVMALLGHEVKQPLAVMTSLHELLQEASTMVFSKQEQVRNIDLDHVVTTGVMERVPHFEPES